MLRKILIYGCFATNKHCTQDNILYFYLQCQWSHIGASLHPRTAGTYRIPATARPPVLLLNLLYAAGPALLALRCAAGVFSFPCTHGSN